MPEFIHKQCDAKVSQQADGWHCEKCGRIPYAERAPGKPPYSVTIVNEPGSFSPATIVSGDPLLPRGVAKHADTRVRRMMNEGGEFRSKMNDGTEIWRYKQAEWLVKFDAITNRWSVQAVYPLGASPGVIVAI